MNKTLLFKVQRKYLDILGWLIKNGYTVPDFRSMEDLEQNHKRGELFIYGEMKISRGYDGIECGSPSKKDLIDYSLTTEFEFTIGKTLEAVKKWHAFIESNQNHYFSGKPLGFPFQNCRVNCYGDDNKVQVKTPYKFGTGVKKGPGDGNNYDLEYFIPIKITYTVEKISIEPRGLTQKEIDGARII